jgi:hypothetical protein
VSDPEFDAYIAEMEAHEREVARVEEFVATHLILPPAWLGSDGTDEQLAALARRDDTAARERLVRRYHGLVRLRAARYFVAADQYGKLVEAGLAGLDLAIRHFRPERDGRFQDIAALCIGGKMRMAANRR